MVETDTLTPCPRSHSSQWRSCLASRKVRPPSLTPLQSDALLHPLPAHPRSFCSLPYPEHHLTLHHEVRDLHEQWVRQPPHPARGGIKSEPEDQPRLALVDRV